MTDLHWFVIALFTVIIVIGLVINLTLTVETRKNSMRNSCRLYELRVDDLGKVTINEIKSSDKYKHVR